MKSKVIQKNSLIVEKVSGKYSCPHYVDPSSMDELLLAHNVVADFEAKKMLAEVAENFACELVKAIGTSKITKESIIACTKTISIA